MKCWPNADVRLKSSRYLITSGCAVTNRANWRPWPDTMRPEQQSQYVAAGTSKVNRYKLCVSRQCEKAESKPQISYVSALHWQLQTLRATDMQSQNERHQGSLGSANSAFGTFWQDCGKEGILRYAYKIWQFTCTKDETGPQVDIVHHVMLISGVLCSHSFLCHASETIQCQGQKLLSKDYSLSEAGVEPQACLS